MLLGSFRLDLNPANDQTAQAKPNSQQSQLVSAQSSHVSSNWTNQLKAIAECFKDYHVIKIKTRTTHHSDFENAGREVRRENLLSFGIYAKKIFLCCETANETWHRNRQERKLS